MKKTILALLLVLGMMASVLSGCGNAAAPAEESGSTAAAASEAAEAAESPAEAVEAEAPAEAAEASVADAEESAVEEVAVELPPYEPGEELTQVSMLFQFMPFFQSWFPEGWASSPWWDEFESRTNTEWDLREVSGMAWQENVNLLCASGDLPDVVSNIGNVYAGGVSGAIRDEMVIDLAPMIQESAPYYFSIVSQDDYTMKTLVNDDGQMGAMFATLNPVRSVSNGLWIRKDWLDGLGMDVPASTDELKQVLQGFKDTYGADIGLYQMVHMNENKVFCAVEGVWNAFGPNDFYLDASWPVLLYGTDDPSLLPVSGKHAFVVLGLQLADGEMTDELKARCDAAAAAAKAFPESVLVCSGGATGENNPARHTEAGLMKSWLTKHCGIAASRILTDEKAMTTAENALNTFEILRQQGIESITLITSDYHQRRASLCFCAAGSEQGSGTQPKTGDRTL